MAHIVGTATITHDNQSETNHINLATGFTIGSNSITFDKFDIYMRTYVRAHNARYTRVRNEFDSFGAMCGGPAAAEALQLACAVNSPP